MAAAKTEGYHPGEFLLSESPSAISRDTKTVTVGATTTLVPGTVLGKLATGKYVVFDQDGSDGSEVGAGILYDRVENAEVAPADIAAVVVDWTCEVRGDALTWPGDIEAGEQAAAIVDLAALGVKVR